MNYKHLQGWFVLILILGSILAFSATPYQPKYSIYNEGELGASSLRAGLEDLSFNISRLLISPIILNTEHDIEVMVIIGSERRYTSAEVDAYEQFVDQGGMLFIFEDFGPAKQIANRMGITFMPGILRETQTELQVNRPTQIFVQDLIISQFLVDTGFPPLLVSEAAALLDIIGMAQGITLPLLLTFPTAFLDTDNDNTMELTDLRSPIGFPIGLMKFYGNGTLIVVGDSSLPLNRYWQRSITLLDQEYTLTNALWTLLLMSTLINSYGKGSIVFDESHQDISLVSAAGIFNLLAGTWVGLWNTIEVTIVLMLVTIGFTSSRIRSKFTKNRFKRKRESNIKTTNPDIISNPSYAEKAISEQYILYNVMKENFIQIANSNLIQKLRDTNKADAFLEEMKHKYQVEDLTQPMIFDQLLSLHTDLRLFVDENLNKWL
ncbi:MAG: hypothetical protein INQ03_05635 [Candidatus Heimdallarchaeota archaeon]|nr:hypothetical protein [Candidatus Heimdallarchaeota archaeon]